MQPVFNPFRGVYQWSLASFLLAALTGFLYRYGMIFPLPDIIPLSNIRHAHSHLMFFNWITPPIMAWMALNLQSHTGQSINNSRYTICLYSMLFLGILSWPFFLIFGYHGVPIGNLQLPLAAIISGLIMLTWYWFAWLYYQNRKKADFPGNSPISIQLFDAALLALIISSLGAWGVSVFQFGDTPNPLISSALTHFFLSVFTEGWAMLGVLGLIWSRADARPVSIRTGWLWKPVLTGSMLVFPLGFSQSMVTPLMLWSAKFGLVLILLSFSVHLFLLIKFRFPQDFVWYSIIGFIVLKILFQSASILPFDFWIGSHGLRILYLHLLLLGFVSVSMIRFLPFVKAEQDYSKTIFTLSVWLLIISLIVISGYWPANWLPSYLYHWVLFIALLPFFAGIFLMIRNWYFVHQSTNSNG